MALFDNHQDPYQQQNLVDELPQVVSDMEQRLDQLLSGYADHFPPEQEYLDRWGWPTNRQGTVPFKKDSGVGLSPNSNPTLGIAAR